MVCLLHRATIIITFRLFNWLQVMYRRAETYMLVAPRTKCRSHWEGRILGRSSAD